MLLFISGLKEPLTVKFADGGNKKKTPSRQWVDRANMQEVGTNIYHSRYLKDHNYRH